MIRRRPRGRAFATVAVILAVGAAIAATPVSGGLPPSSERCFGERATMTAFPGRTVGSPGNDVIVGTDGDERVNGRGGRDLICTGPGDDVLKGGGRADKLNGQGDEDIVIGGNGNDKHVGGPGSDTIRANTGSPSARDVAKGSDGDDNIEVLDGAANDRAVGGPGANNCAFDPGDRVSGCG